ncbi:hypothetical protein NDU88_001369, partial [Pleurodeles waltl]
MPFGLASAAAVFQRAMERLLGGLQGIKVYQDDILVYGRDEKEHNERVRGVLQRLEKSGLTLKAGKCKFNVHEIDYLGHKISSKGIEPKKELVDTIINF